MNDLDPRSCVVQTLGVEPVWLSETMWLCFSDVTNARRTVNCTNTTAWLRIDALPTGEYLRRQFSIWGKLPMTRRRRGVRHYEFLMSIRTNRSTKSICLPLKRNPFAKILMPFLSVCHTWNCPVREPLETAGWGVKSGMNLSWTRSGKSVLTATRPRLLFRKFWSCWW